MIDEQNFFDQLVRNNLRTYDSIRKIATGQGDDNITGCLLDYNYFKNYYKIIGIDLSKNKRLMLIKRQYNKLILQGIYNHLQNI